MGKIKDNFLIGTIVLLITGLAFVFRVYNVYPFVFPGDGHVYLPGIDPTFYIRHIFAAFRDFPALQQFDHATHFPNGIVSDATGLYTWLSAALCRLLLPASADMDAVAGIMAWIPPVFGALSYVVVFLLIKALRNKIAAIFAMFMYLLHPGLSLPRSILGFADHHFLEVFISLCIVLSLTWLVKIGTSKKIHYFICLTAALPLLSIFTVWQGSPLYVILINVTTLLYLILANKSPLEKFNLSLHFGIYYAITAILYLLTSLLFPELLTNAFPRYEKLIPLIFITGGVVNILYARYVEAYPRLLKWRHSKWFILLGFIVAAMGILYFTGPGQEILHRLNYRDTGIGENRPVDWRNFVEMMAFPGLLAVSYIIINLLNWVRDHKKDYREIPVMVFAIFFVFMWLNTYDMGYMIAPYIAILAGLAVYDLLFFSFKKSVTIKNPVGSVLVQIIPVVVLILAFLKPVVLMSGKYPFVYEERQIQGSIYYDKTWYDAMEWMQNNTPSLSYPVEKIYTQENFNPSDEDTHYGVLSSWDNGNIINARGKRIPLWSRWPNPAITQWWVEPFDSSFIFNLYPRHENFPVKYIIVDSKMAGSFFTSKYAASGKELKECTLQSTFIIDKKEVELPVYDSCYSKSTIVQLIKNTRDSIGDYRLLWSSENTSFICQNYAKTGLSVIDIPTNQLSAEQIQHLKQNDSMKTPGGLLYHCEEVSQIRIYGIKTEQ